MEQDKLLTIQEVAEVLKIAQSTIRRWLNEGKMKGVKLGRQWRVKQSELDRIIEQGIQE